MFKISLYFQESMHTECALVHTYIHTHTHTHIYIYIYTHTHKHTLRHTTSIIGRRMCKV